MNMRKRNSIANYARKTIILLLILSLLPCNLLHASAFTVNNGIMKSSYKFNPYVEDNIDMKDSYKVEFAIESEWENHYNGKITIKNISDQDIKNWTLSFVSKDTIENIWSAEIEKHDNDTYIIKNSGWNQDIKAGQEISFGFTASYKQEADTPHDFLMQNLCLDNTDKEETVTNNSYEVKFVIESEWENHYNGKIIIKNISDKDIKNWTLSFISKDIIENIWSAKIEKHDNDTYLVKNLGWNQDIKAGQEISFGFTASYKQEANTPHNFLIPNLYKDDVTENDNNLDDLDESDELDDFFEAELTIESEWENHYNGKITVKNISDKDIENWKLSFISKDTIENIWSAKIDAHDSDTYVVKNLGWNQDIKAGQEISFGFTASYKQEADAPHDFYMSSLCKKVEATHMIDYKIVSNWGTGLNGEITVKNTSNKVIEDWRLIFESNLDIERFWTAEVDGKEGNIYFVKNLGYNANIAPGETLTLGFSAKGTEGKILMKEFTLYYMDVYTEDTTDTDGDGLYDTYEKTLGTNPEKKDSDSDGLDDYFEVYTLATDPLKADSDGNGVSDAEEDNDKDGLSNMEEYKLGTNPTNNDSDGDGLTDKEEYTIYKTDPLNEDTDNDGLTDKEEIDLGFNPLLADTDGNGIIDSEENLKQVAVYNGFWDDTLIKEIQISATVYGDIYDALFLDDMIDDIEDVKGVVSGFYEIENEEEYKLSTKFFLDKTKDYNIHNLVVLKIGRRDREVVETIADEKNAALSVEIDDSNAIYCVVNRILYENGKSDTDSTSKNSNGKFPVSRKKKGKSKVDILKEKLTDQIKKDQKNKRYLRIYSPEEAVDLVLKYDDTISAASTKLGIQKAMIQAILFRELACINPLDLLGDIAVQNYYINQYLLEEYMNKSWMQQLISGPPQMSLPQREDCSTGLGQIFAKTGIKARNCFLSKGQKKYTYSNWKQRKKVWYKLKDDNKYNTTMVAKVLKMEAGNIFLVVPTKKDASLVMSRYNYGGVKKSTKYGKECYRYYKFFKSFNGWKGM